MNQNTIKYKVSQIRERYLKPDATFTLQEFDAIFKLLGPEIVLYSEHLAEIFNSWDANKVGRIGSQDIDEMLQNLVSQGITPRTSIAQTKNATTQELEHNNKSNTIDNQILENLTLEKMSQLKNIMDICDPHNKGKVPISHIENLVSALTLDKETNDLLQFFSLLTNKDTNTVSREDFNNMLSELEKNIFTGLDGVVLDENAHKNECNLNMDHQHLKESDDDDDDVSYEKSEDFLSVPDDYGQKYIEIMLRNIDAIKSMKIKNSQAHDIINEMLKVMNFIQDKLKHGVERSAKYIQKIKEGMSMQDFLKSKVTSLEEELKRLLSGRDALLQQFEELSLTIELLEAEKKNLLKSNAELKDQAREAIALESQISTICGERDYYQDKVSKLEIEKANLKVDLNQLDQLYNRLENEFKEISSKLSEKDHELIKKKTSLEQTFPNDKLYEKLNYDLDLYKRENKNLLEEMEKMEKKLETFDKENLRCKELISVLNLEKKDLQEKTLRLEEEIGMRSRRGTIMKLSTTRRIGQNSIIGNELSRQFQSIYQRPSQFTQFTKLIPANIEEEKEDDKDDKDDNDTRRYSSAYMQIKNSLLPVFSKRINTVSIMNISNQKPLEVPNTFKLESNTNYEKLSFGEKRSQTIQEVSQPTMKNEKKFKMPELSGKNNLAIDPESINEEYLALPAKLNPVSQFLSPRFCGLPLSTKHQNENENMQIQKKNNDNIEKIEEKEEKVQVLESKHAIHEENSINQGFNNMDSSNVETIKKENLAKFSLIDPKANDGLKEIDLMASHIERPSYFFNNGEESLFARDYLSLRENPKIMKILDKHKEDKLYLKCFSDYMTIINADGTKKKRIMFITANAFYCLRPNKNLALLRRIPLEKIYKVTIFIKSTLLIAIHVKNEYDYLMETYKRPNTILYLIETFKSNMIPMFQIAFSNSFTVKNQIIGKKTDIREYETSKLHPELQGVYKNVIKLGFLYHLTDSWWTPWKQYFFILTDIGFMAFTKPGKRDPLHFFPIVGYCNIIENPKFEEKPHSFKILYTESKNELVLAASSQSEKAEWLKHIKLVEEKARKKIIQETEIKTYTQRMNTIN